MGLQLLLLSHCCFVFSNLRSPVLWDQCILKFTWKLDWAYHENNFVKPLIVEEMQQHQPVLLTRVHSLLSLSLSMSVSLSSLWAHLLMMGMLELARSFYSVLVFVSVIMTLSTVFHSINSPDNSLLSHSVLLALFLPYWSFQLYISLWKSPSALI